MSAPDIAKLFPEAVRARFTIWPLGQRVALRCKKCGERFSNAADHVKVSAVLKLLDHAASHDAPTVRQ